MPSIGDQVANSLASSRESRQAFVEETVATRITAQIKALRESKGMDYRQFAEKIGKKVSWAYRLEDPNAPPPTISTLLEIAAAFDIALDVRFCSFSQILNEVVSLTPDSFQVHSFEEELKRAALEPKPKSHRRRTGQRTGRPLPSTLLPKSKRG
jgi:transcriptional regulator with XRE-family HTH domain